METFTHEDMHYYYQIIENWYDFLSDDTWTDLIKNCAMKSEESRDAFIVLSEMINYTDPGDKYPYHDKWKIVENIEGLRKLLAILRAQVDMDEAEERDFDRNSFDTNYNDMVELYEYCKGKGNCHLEELSSVILLTKQYLFITAEVWKIVETIVENHQDVDFQTELYNAWCGSEGSKNDYIQLMMDISLGECGIGDELFDTFFQGLPRDYIMEYIHMSDLTKEKTTEAIQKVNQMVMDVKAYKDAHLGNIVKSMRELDPGTFTAQEDLKFRDLIKFVASVQRQRFGGGHALRINVARRLYSYMTNMQWGDI